MRRRGRSHVRGRIDDDYCSRHDETEVPDPYYGGPGGFETVLDILEDACGNLLEKLNRA